MAIVLGAKDNLIIVLLLLKIALARHKWWAGRSQMEYHLVEYERPTYFQLSIAYADINYCFANFTYVERFVIMAY